MVVAAARPLHGDFVGAPLAERLRGGVRVARLGGAEQEGAGALPFPGDVHVPRCPVPVDAEREFQRVVRRRPAIAAIVDAVVPRAAPGAWIGGVGVVEVHLHEIEDAPLGDCPDVLRIDLVELQEPVRAEPRGARVRHEAEEGGRVRRR